MSPAWRIRIFIAVLLLLTLGMGYVYFTKRLTPEEKQRLAQLSQPTPTPSPSAAPSPEILNFAQMLAVPYNLDQVETASESAVLSFISNNKPGFVVLFGQSVTAETAQEKIQEIVTETAASERPLIAVDHEGGRVQRLSGKGFTKLPTWKRLCEQNKAQRMAMLASSSAELKAVGVEIVLAPVVDLAEYNSVMRDRICDDNPEVVTTAALDFIQAFEKNGIYSVLKHYPGIGTAALDTHKGPATVLVTQKDTEPFKNILDKYPSLGVMTAHVGVENQNSTTPCSLSVNCVSQLFELYPETVVFSDALEMAAARYSEKFPDTPKSLPQVTYEAIMAGNTVLVFGEGVTAADLEAVLSRMKLEYTSSSEFRTRVNESVKKIEKLRAQYIVESDTESELE